MDLSSQNSHDAAHHASRYRVAVRDIVAAALQSGDLSPGRLRSSRLVEGTELHALVRRRRGGDYRSEVPVSRDIRPDHAPGEAGPTQDAEPFGAAPFGAKPLIIEIHGRIDGLFHDDGLLVVEEIKSSKREELFSSDTVFDRNDLLDPGRIRNRSVAQHWAQAVCYAALLLPDVEDRRVGVQLTYIHPESLAERSTRTDLGRREVESYLRQLVAPTARRLAATERHRAARDAGIRSAHFPFRSPRPGQETLMSRMEAFLAGTGRSRTMFVHAPTGSGKTMATLFPAARSLSTGHVERVFYLAAKGTGKDAAVDAADRLRRSGVGLRTVVLTAKEKICFHPPEAVGARGECRASRCPFALGYFDRNRAAIDESWQGTRFTASEIAELARRHTVCPFELSLDLSETADLVVGDYNYLFDPRVFLRRHFQSPGRYLALVDEAHNLPDRARAMYSASLSKQAVLAARRGVATEIKGLRSALGRLNRWYLDAAKEAGETRAVVETEMPPALIELVEDVHTELERFIDGTVDPEDTVWDLYYAAATFLRTAAAFSERYRYCLEPGSGREVIARLFCVDPAAAVESALSRCRRSVLFSGTFVPMEYFVRLLSTDSAPATVVLPSPFPEENRSVVVYDGIDTRYRQRESSYSPLAEIIVSISAAEPGNYVAYFPSYSYLSRVHTEYRLLNPTGRAVVQNRGMDDESRAEFLAHLAVSDADADGVTAFCVLGGVFAEGIDLPGRRIDGAIITGVGLPAVSLEREIIKDYFEETTGHGFLYAYVYPGMNRIIQAGGRVIRSETDRGVIILAGRRLSQQPYRRILEEVWPDAVECRDAAKLASMVREFWESG